MTREADGADVGLALRAVVCGVLLGTAVIAMTLWVVRTLQLAAPPAAVPNTAGTQALILMGGTLAGVLVGATATWFLLGPIDSLYRRGAFSTVAGFATLLAALVSMPLDRAFGRLGLLAMAAVAVLGCLWLGRGLRPERRPIS